MTGTARAATRSTVEEAWQAARDSGRDAGVRPGQRQCGFAYEEDDGSTHVVWLLDAASAYNQIAFLRRAGHRRRRAVAAGRGGSRRSGRSSAAIAPHAAARHRRSTTIPAGTDVDIEGTGEILKIAAMPVAGQRDVDRPRRTATIADVALPRSCPATMWSQRTGYRPTQVALTFDDGPDPQLDAADPRHPQARSTCPRPSSSSARTR